MTSFGSGKLYYSLDKQKYMKEEEEKTGALKSCPFCGCNEPMVIEHSSADWVIHCKKCHAKTGRFNTYQGALFAWNARNEPCTLPEWAIEQINAVINENKSGSEDDYYYDALKWVISLRKGGG
jgi:Lar family restriction alleviation protein